MVTTPRQTQSHGPSRHGPECTCTRCTGFAKGNQVSKGNRGPVTHGATAHLRIVEEAGPIADTLRDQVPEGIESDDAAIEVAAYVLRQLQLSAVEFERVARGEGSKASRSELLRLSEDSRGWTRTALEALACLGLTPKGRASLNLAVAHTRAADRGRIELGKLDEDEIAELRRLLEKASEESLALAERADA